MIDVEVKVVNEDRGAKKLARQLAKDIEVSFGWTGPKALKTHKNSENTIEDDMVTHEFGGYVKGDDGKMHRVPRRSVIADYFDQNLSKIFTEFSLAMKAVVNNGKTARQALTLFGDIQVENMRDRILSGINPPLHPMTVDNRRNRGNSDTTPLFDTEQASEALESEVKVG